MNVRRDLCCWGLRAGQDGRWLREYSEHSRSGGGGEQRRRTAASESAVGDYNASQDRRQSQKPGLYGKR